MFSDAGPDVRWIGNERGLAGDPTWSTVDPAAVPYPGVSGAPVIATLQHGDPAGPVWRPGETDVSIRPGWFYHAAEDARVRSVDNLVELYFTSVGRNSKLLLNVPPARDGLLHDIDVARLAAMRDRLATLFRDDVAGGRRVDWRSTGDRTAVAEIDLGRSINVELSDLREDISRGQVVARYAVEGSDGGSWRLLARGTRSAAASSIASSRSAWGACGSPSRMRSTRRSGCTSPSMLDRTSLTASSASHSRQDSAGDARARLVHVDAHRIQPSPREVVLSGVSRPDVARPAGRELCILVLAARRLNIGDGDGASHREERRPVERRRAVQPFGDRPVQLRVARVIDPAAQPGQMSRV